jgi:glycosyltransferase involved in cell wall biosynthesis
MKRPLRIIDIINAAASAKEMLLNRLRYLHRPPFIENGVVCSAGPHVELLRAEGIPVTVIDTPRTLAPAALAQATARLTRFLRHAEPDIVHTHCSVPGLIGRVAARLAGVPILVHTVHGFHFHAHSGRLARRGFSLAERALAAGTDMLLTENREDLHVIRRWRRPRPRARWVGNGIDVDRYARHPRAHAAPGRVVACIGRFEPVKNHADLLHVFARVHATCPDARLRLLGDGPLRSECERLAADLGIADVTDFLGYREDVDVLLGDVDVGVLLSWKEGMSRALLEPMAAGIPVVAWRVKGNRELVRSGETGFLTAVGDLDATAAHIVRLLEDAELRARLGAGAAERVRRHFDEALVVDRLRAAYTELLDEAGHQLPAAWQRVPPEGPDERRAVLSA